MKVLRFTLLTAAFFTLLIVGLSKESKAEVNFSFGFYTPPIQAQVVYFPVSVFNSPDVHRHHGHWYRHLRGRWYRAAVYGGPWINIGFNLVPQPVAYKIHKPRHRNNKHAHYKPWKRWKHKKWSRHQHRDRDYKRHAKRHQKVERYSKKRDRHGDGERHSKRGKNGSSRARYGAHR